eukprot:TRINITY_DN9389_c0_g1_i1.p1 TRINITY_DN9389_c0_g1~~TRINITY_DN9389_c0_g1_i1.p1  ORF type:complete len:147 (+),score=64.27 TRINITY_DN9389_c0_g1_i1:87-527(+)
MCELGRESGKKGGVPDGPLMTDGKLNIPVSVVDSHCAPMMDQSTACQESYGKGAEQCRGLAQATHECINHAIYNYVALRKLCKREYTAWAKCMNECATAEMGAEEAAGRCGVFRTPLDTCSMDLSMPAAKVAMEKKMNPKDIPEQR